MRAVLGLITGSGFHHPPDLVDGQDRPVDTPYGPVTITAGTWQGHPVVFLPRHGADHSVAPHAINYRANIRGLLAAGATSIVATAVSGGINPALPPGTLVLIDDFIDFTHSRADTFFDGIIDPQLPHRSTGPVTHIDMTEPYDPELRGHLRDAARLEGVEVVDGGTYCATNGPRFESAAEIRMMAQMGGDLVGMTGYPEVALAREAGIPYASIGVISNWAAGLSPEPLSISDILGVIEHTGDRLYRLISRTVNTYGPEPVA